MNRDEFLREALESGLVDDSFKDKYRKFNEYQDLAMKTLNEVHRVCEKNNIQYFLAFGSLLGAVRDGGQIPWDYDVDICVRINDREALIEALKNDLDSNFYFYCPEVDDKCRHTIMRIAPVGYCSEALHVDVFYLVGLPDDKKEKEKIQRQLISLGRKRYLKKVKILAEAQGNIIRIIKLACGKLACLFFSNEKINREYEYLAHKYQINPTGRTCTADVFARINELPAIVFDDSIILETREGEFRVPKRYIEFLECKYGDYKEYLPIAERINEVLTSYNYLEHYRTM